jgi:hypothetical protein
VAACPAFGSGQTSLVLSVEASCEPSAVCMHEATCHCSVARLCLPQNMNQMQMTMRGVIKFGALKLVKLSHFCIANKAGVLGTGANSETKNTVSKYWHVDVLLHAKSSDSQISFCQ